ncbi:FGGY family carbohydrate kinase [Streptomyces sanglieri]|uniref:FGGY family carbohydrate kinase n=1 Tax=Streptomyces sanglieri TaxID=193460 RepID=A0ABW2WKS5_9ACTN
MARQAVVGIDAGTTAVKAVVLAWDGRQLGWARAPLGVTHHGDRVEQDMDEVWSAVRDTVRSAVRQAGDSVEIAAVGVTGQGDGAWLVDADGRPCGPARIWMDGTAADRGARWEADGRGALVHEVTGSSLFPGALPVLLEQLEADYPERLAQAAHHLNCKDWIRFRLTGEVATDASEASRTYLDVAAGKYSDALIEGLGHQRFRRLLAPVLPPRPRRAASPPRPPPPPVCRSASRSPPVWSTPPRAGSASGRSGRATPTSSWAPPRSPLPCTATAGTAEPRARSPWRPAWTDRPSPASPP